jgi:hypothetical protein
VLPRGFGARSHLEGAPGAAQAPEDPARAGFQLVVGPGAARRDEDVPVGLGIDRVEVKPVPWRRLRRRRLGL